MNGSRCWALWTEYDAISEMGLIQLSNEYRKVESPQVDGRATIEMRRKRCRGWGFDSANRKDEERQCVGGVESDFSKWRVVRKYRCTRNK